MVTIQLRLVIVIHDSYIWSHSLSHCKGCSTQIFWHHYWKHLLAPEWNLQCVVTIYVCVLVHTGHDWARDYDQWRPEGLPQQPQSEVSTSTNTVNRITFYNLGLISQIALEALVLIIHIAKEVFLLCVLIATKIDQLGNMYWMVA